MATLITRTGKGSALNTSEHDENMKRETNPQSGDYTILADDNRACVQYTGSGGNTFTLPDVSTLLAAEDTGDFIVTLKHNGTGTLTIAPAALNTIDSVDRDVVLQPTECLTLKGAGSDNWLVVGAVRTPAGLLMYKTVDTGAAASGFNTVTFGVNTTDVYDTVDAHTGGNNYWTVPVGYTWMRVVGQVAIYADATGIRGANLYDNTAGTNLTPRVRTLVPTAGSGTDTIVQINSGWLQVTAGNNYVLQGYHSGSTDPTLTYSATDTWVMVEFK